MDHGFDSAEKVVVTAKLFAGLDSCTIWAMLALSCLVYIFWSKREELKNSEAWRGIRERQLISDAADTEVLRHLTEEVVAVKMLITKYLIKE